MSTQETLLETEAAPPRITRRTFLIWSAGLAVCMMDPLIVAATGPETAKSGGYGVGSYGAGKFLGQSAHTIYLPAVIKKAND